MYEHPMWTWSLKRHAPVRDRDFFISGHFNEPPDVWRRASEKLVRLQDFVFDVKVARRGYDLITVEGNVASEQVKRLFSEILTDFDPKARIANDLEVTAPFRSAEDDDFTIELKGNLSIAGPAPTVPVERYPLFKSGETPVMGRRFRFEVDLSTAASDYPLIRFDLPPDWQMVAIDVDVHSAQLRFDDRMKRRKIALFEDGRSMSAIFEGEVIGATADGAIEVLASFACEGRYAGEATTRFAMAEESEPAPAAQATAGVVAARPDSVPPDMMIRIHEAGDKWLWIVDAEGVRGSGSGPSHDTIELGDTETFAISLLKQCPQMNSPQHAGRLRSIGEDIWGKAPQTFHALYKDMRAKFGPTFSIQIITAEPHVPWEMMYPDARSGIDDPDHLYMTHPISRWSAAFAREMRPRLKRGSIASFVPDYGPATVLPSAIEEGKWLVSELGAKAMPATVGALTDLWKTGLSNERVSVLHFAGHGASQPVPCIKMLDGEVTRDDINGAVKLGENDWTFVVLNACEVGAVEMRLGLASGWTERLIKQNFGGVLAPLWKVEDAYASQVVRTYLDKFCRRGLPIGKAMMLARSSQRDGSATPYAYVCYGDVNAKADLP
ncbi:CHAT domain-containing protein [Bradyrhizobium liaoningense]|uniref:CHAT domain-containing protein n=1 Tax=Bradyrhizobium liaoningense TaxID=43992 RepID=UPI001BA62A1B|nr:CHAT domain-containing protein [Bradyrhizobium liaoningense]MBR0736957.1 CHAT domain-containing protein [Bradyrhizobium liaoningense]